MLKSLHTIWLTGLTLVALVLSSMPVNASLNSPVLNQAGAQPSLSLSHDAHIDCSSSQHETLAVKTDCHNTANSDVSAHQCCPASCTASYPLISQVIVSHHQTSRLIPFLADTVEYANSVTRSLYRPPIV
ncbi:hypothetical protein CTH30272_00648 [Allocatenococcus thiocycli]|nr:hypothetical protein CTH30272_00648 [Catenococcus thiocycli]